MEISDKFADRIRARITSGRYDDPDQVLERALDLLDWAESEENDIRVKVAEGVAQLDQGEQISAEKVLAELRARLTK